MDGDLYISYNNFISLCENTLNYNGQNSKPYPLANKLYETISLQ